MTYQVLARKWRPKKYSDVVGQGHITQSIQNALKTGKVGHAYLMVGTRGVGKTSVARLFAKSLRCENRSDTQDACGKCAGCLEFDTDSSMNVIEIDGASNNSVDNIRDLISNVQFLPTSGEKKVYIIDEVHMLSNSAFNALLKTLEEPPKHVVFILATTEVQKLLGTVLSRCQRFDFRNVSNDELKNHIEEICRVEKISIKESHLKSIAKLGRGSVRDTLSLLDQCLAYSVENNISDDVLARALGVASSDLVTELLKAIYLGKQEAVKANYRKFLSENIPLKNIVESLLDEVFAQLEAFDQRPTYAEILSKPEIVWIFETLARETEWCFATLLPEKTVEVILYKVALRREFFNQPMAVSQKTTEKKTTESNLAPKREEKPVIKPEVKSEVVAEKMPEPKELETEKDWDHFLSFISKKAPATASNLEQGNLVAPLFYDQRVAKLEIGFGVAGKVFFDYLNDQEVTQKIRTMMAEFFHVSDENAQIRFQLIDSGTDFKSTADIREENEKIDEDNKINNFKTNPLLLKAEQMFNSKIDKVIIDKKK